MSETKRMQLYLPNELKVDLEKMADEVGLSQNNLAVLALQSLVRNYDSKGTHIFVDLLSPTNKNSGNEGAK